MSVKEKIVGAGQAVASTAKTVGHKIAQEAEHAAGWVKEKTSSDVGVGGIQERMDVIASCGHKIGVVDHVEGANIKLTKAGSNDGQHHFIPLAWVERVDSHVHLSKNSVEAVEGWKSESTGSCCGS